MRGYLRATYQKRSDSPPYATSGAASKVMFHWSRSILTRAQPTPIWHEACLNVTSYQWIIARWRNTTLIQLGRDPSCDTTNHHQSAQYLINDCFWRYLIWFFSNEPVRIAIKYLTALSTVAFYYERERKDEIEIDVIDSTPSFARLHFSIVNGPWLHVDGNFINGKSMSDSKLLYCIVIYVGCPFTFRFINELMGLVK